MIHPVDKYVGSRLRLRRTELGLTQQNLGKSVGITFQQVQKYERGINRISVSRLYEFSQIMKTPVEWFLKGYGNSNKNTDNNKEIMKLIKIYHLIPENSRTYALKMLNFIAKTSA